MKILHIDSENSWRGGQQQIFYLLLGLRKRGYHPLLIAPPKSPLAEKAKEQGLKVFPLKMRYEWNIFSVREIRKIIEENRIKIIHLHSSSAHSLGVLAAKSVGSCKTILSRRVCFPVRNNPFSRMKYGKVDRIIAISNSVKRNLIESGVNSEKINVVYSGCDWRKFQHIDGTYLFSELKIKKEVPRVGIISALTYEKNHLTFLHSARMVLEQFGQVQFLIVGEGKQRAGIEKRIKELKLEKTVRLLGFRQDIPQILSILDIFVLCSSREGLGGSILEAMASRLPIVATKVGGIPEIIKDGDNGFLVEPQQPDSLAEKIGFLLKNKTRAAQMSENSFHLVTEKFSVESMVEGTIKAYEQLLR
jgi:glycosyltransferase involved in cell wall biosynthesis